MMTGLLLTALLCSTAYAWFQFSVPSYYSFDRWKGSPSDSWSYDAINSMKPYPPLFPLALEFLSDADRFSKEEVEDRREVLPEYDFIIVGAGTAGCILANRLTENATWKVLLIEAGDSENYAMDIPITTQFLQLSYVNWKYKSLPSHFAFKDGVDGRTPLAQGKVMGGSSTLSYGVYARGHPSDYDNWEAMGNTGWGWDQVSHYFKKSEDFLVPWSRTNAPFEEEYHSLEGYQGISAVEGRTPLAQAYLDAGEELGLSPIDYNGKSMIGISPLQVTAKEGMKMSSNAAFLHPIRHRPNLHVIKKSHVTKLTIDKSTKTVRGVQFRRAGVNCQVTATKEVVVSAGAVGSPHLLMLSGIGPKKNLKSVGIDLIRKLPVGFNLMDHPSLAAVTVRVNKTVDLNEKTLTGNPSVTEGFLRNGEGLYSIPAGIEAVAFVDSDEISTGNVDSVPDIEIKFKSATLSAHKALHVTHGIKKNVFQEIHKKLSGKHGFTAFVSSLKSNNSGRVFLNSSDPFDKPFVYTDYFEDSEDVEKLISGVEFVKTLLETESMKRLDAELLEELAPACRCDPKNSTTYWRCHAKHLSVSSYNLCGTCKMGPTGDKTAVVDPKLRVHGVRSLRVVDSSVIPKIPSSDIGAAVMMIAEKAADLIREDYRDVPFDMSK